MEEKSNKKNGFFKVFETLILVILIAVAIVIVVETFFDQLYGDYEEYEDYEYVDYSYSDYDYDYDYDNTYDDNDYYNEYANNVYSNSNSSNNSNDSSNLNNSSNTTNSNFGTIEEFMNSEYGKEFLEKANKNVVVSNEIETQNAVTNETENTVSDNFIGKEELYNYYDAQKAMKEKFEEQKKKVEIKDEGKSTNNEIMVSIKNNDEDFLYDVTLNTIFFKDNEIVSIDVQEINVIDGNSTRYIKVSGIPEAYDNYEFLISKRYYMEYYYELLNDDVNFSSKENGEYIQISAKNESNKKINRIQFTILYFDQAGKLIDLENVQDYSLRSKKTKSLIGYGIWNEKTNDYLEYSDYKVILDSAEYYGV